MDLEDRMQLLLDVTHHEAWPHFQSTHRMSTMICQTSMLPKRSQSKSGRLSLQVCSFGLSTPPRFPVTSYFRVTEKYEYIGRLLRPGETSRNYSEGESEGSSSEEEAESPDSDKPKAE